MIGQRMMVGEDAVWQYTINTEATASGAKKSAVPLNLYGQDGVRVVVDWGDGTRETFTSADYSANDSTASVHEYAAAGTYIVKMACKKSMPLRLLVLGTTSELTASNKTNSTEAIYWFRTTITSVDAPLPRIKGVASYPYFDSATFSTIDASARYLFCRCVALGGIPNDLFRNNVRLTDLSACFYGCSYLPSISGELFTGLTALTDINYCFRGCLALGEIPDGLLADNVALTTATHCFYGCAASDVPEDLLANNTAITSLASFLYSCPNLGNFALHIGSSEVTSASTFVSAKTGTTRTIYVPSGSTTQATFNAVASNLGLTIIGE